MATLELTARAILDVAMRQLVLDVDVPLGDGHAFTLSGWPGEASSNDGRYLTAGSRVERATRAQTVRPALNVQPARRRRVSPTATIQLAQTHIALASMPRGAVTADATGVTLTVEII